MTRTYNAPPWFHRTFRTAWILLIMGIVCGLVAVLLLHPEISPRLGGAAGIFGLVICALARDEYE